MVYAEPVDSFSPHQATTNLYYRCCPCVAVNREVVITRVDGEIWNIHNGFLDEHLQDWASI